MFKDCDVIIYDGDNELISSCVAKSLFTSREIAWSKKDNERHANGGQLLRDLRMPDFRDYEVKVPFPGAVEAQDMTAMGYFVRDIYRLNSAERNFRVFGRNIQIYVWSLLRL